MYFIKSKMNSSSNLDKENEKKASIIKLSRISKLKKYIGIFVFCICIGFISQAAFIKLSDAATKPNNNNNTNRPRVVHAPPKKCNYTHFCQYTIEKAGTTYSVSGYAKYERTCGKNSFPSWGCDLVKSEIIERISPGVLSGSWGLSCGNVHGFSASIVPISGVCGSSNGGTFPAFPKTSLCSVGSVIASSTSATTFDWQCGGGGGSTASCSALKPVGGTLACSANPSTGIVNSPVTFTATVSATTTPASEFTYSWSVNGQSVADDNTFVKTFSEATSTAEVIVTATRGVFQQSVDCNFNRVDCSGGQTYCGDQQNPTSYACVSNSISCPASLCGTGYDSSADKQLGIGGALATTTPSAGYITSNALCGSGSVLRYIGGVSTWSFNVGYSAWGWDCINTQAHNAAKCKARCATGEYYCSTESKCVSNDVSCTCKIAGADFDQREVCVDAAGNCFPCGKVIQYFTLNPSEVPKNQNSKLCGGYWSTISMTEPQKPEGTQATRVICEMSSNGTNTQVSASNPEGGPGYPLAIGTYTLTCTQQYTMVEAPEEEDWVNFMSSTAENKCRALPGVSEN